MVWFALFFSLFFVFFVFLFSFFSLFFLTLHRPERGGLDGWSTLLVRYWYLSPGYLYRCKDREV